MTIHNMKIQRACPLLKGTGTRPQLTSVQNRPVVLTHQHGLVYLTVLAVHLLENDRVPGCVAFIHGNIMLPGPTAEPQLFDKIDVHE
jgi:hypothetical protein